MADQTPPVDPQVGSPPVGAQETAQKLAHQAIDVVGQVAKLAVDVPKDSAKALLVETKKLVARLEKIVE